MMPIFPPYNRATPMINVPLTESKTQRSITLPDRLWQLAISIGNGSFSKGVRIILETHYQNQEKNNAKINN